MVKIACEPTYIFLKPFCFMGKELNNSVELLEEFANNWNIAVSVFKRGDMASFWAENVGMSRANGQWHREEEFQIIHDRMWQIDENINEDILFQKVFYLIEPASDLIPVAIPGSTKTSFMNRVDFLEYIADVFLMYNADLFEKILGGNLNYDPKWNSDYDEKYENLLMICQMFREGSFKCWDLYFIQKRYENPKVADNCDTMQRKSFKTDRDYYTAFKSVLWDAARKTKYNIQKQWAFTLDGEICYSERDFFKMWYSHIDKWSLREVNNFINKLVYHKGENSFADFILGCKKPEVHKKFCAFSEDWKNCSDVFFDYLNTRDYPYLTDFVREKKWRSLKEGRGKANLEECFSQLEDSLQKLEAEIKTYQERYRLIERIFIILYELHRDSAEERLYEKAESIVYMKKRIEKRERAYTELKNYQEDLSYALKFMEEADFEGIWNHTFHENADGESFDGVSSDLVKLFLFHNLCADFTQNCEENRKKFKFFFEKTRMDMSTGWRLAIKEKVSF